MGDVKPTGPAEQARRWLKTGPWVAGVGAVVAIVAGSESSYAEARRAASAPWLSLLAVAAGLAAVAGAWLAVEGWRRGKSLKLWGPGAARAPAPAAGVSNPAGVEKLLATIVLCVGGGLGLVGLKDLRQESARDVPAGQWQQQSDRIDSAWLRIWWGCGLIGAGGGAWLWVIPGRELRAKMVGFGELRGRSLSEITAAVGPAAVIVYGETVNMTWAAPGYSIALGFRDNVCVGVLAEVNPSP